MKKDVVKQFGAIAAKSLKQMQHIQIAQKHGKS